MQLILKQYLLLYATAIDTSFYLLAPSAGCYIHWSNSQWGEPFQLKHSRTQWATAVYISFLLKMQYAISLKYHKTFFYNLVL